MQLSASLQLLLTHRSGSVSVLALALAHLAIWPTWVWYWQRLTDGSDEPLGVLALLTAVAAIAWKRRSLGKSTSGRGYCAPGDLTAGLEVCIADRLILALLLIYCYLSITAPNLLAALIAVSLLITVWRSFLGPGSVSAADLLLAYMSLPVVASLNFYIGYPLRLLSAQLANIMLNISGFTCMSQGTSISWHNQIVDVDAPCSGLRMLWLSIYIAATVASFRKLSFSRTTLLCLISVLAAVLANSFRVTSLFFVEVGVVSVPIDWQDILHQGIGVIAFTLLSGSIMAIALGMNGSHSTSKKDCAIEPQGNGQNCTIAVIANNRENVWSFLRIGQVATRLCVGKAADELRRGNEFDRPAIACLLVALILSAASAIHVLARACVMGGMSNQHSQDSAHHQPARPLSTGGQQASETVQSSQDGTVIFGGWPTEFEGTILVPIPLSRRYKHFYLSEFPGKVAIFGNGKRTVICRWLQRPTRQLHSAQDCYRAAGFDVQSSTVFRDLSGVRWNSFRALRNKKVTLVRERIYDCAGHSWSDVSEWYWSAMFRKSLPPWWSLTVSEDL